MKLYVGVNTPEKMRAGAELGAYGVLTNSNIVLKIYGPDVTLEESTRRMLDESGIRVFQAIHGPDTQTIVEKARRIHAIDPQRVGVKILSNTQGFSAMRVLAAEGIDCIATGMFTYTQALIAADAGAYAISPFVGRGTEAGLDMIQMIRNTRAAYDRMGKAPEILAASIHNLEEVEASFAAGADAVASSYDLLVQMANCELSRKTELSFGEAFARIKGEDVSYLPLAGEDPHAYKE